METSRLGAEGRIEVGAIERALAQLWKDSAEASTKANQGPVTRACSMTLVAPCSNAEQFEHVKSVVERFGSRQPGRAILVFVDPASEEPRIDAQVSAICSLGAPGQSRVCHEHIEIFASGPSVAAAAPAVRALLVPDVFAFLWVPCEKLLSHPLIQDLAHDADALLLDSHRFSDPLSALARADAIAREHPETRAREEQDDLEAVGGFGVHDLEWVRLRPWFEAIASAFDAPAARKIVSEIQSLRVEFVERPTQDPQVRRGVATAALLGGWFASHLGWRLEGAAKRSPSGQRELRLERQGARFVTLAGRDAADHAGAILAVEGRAASGRIRLERAAGSEMATIRVEAGGGASERQVTILAEDDLEALTRAIARAPRDHGFEKALPYALAFHGR